MMQLNDDVTTWMQEERTALWYGSDGSKAVSRTGDFQAEQDDETGEDDEELGPPDKDLDILHGLFASAIIY